MLVSYPAFFYFSPSEGDSFYIYFPDLKGSGSQGDSIEDAMFMASEYLGIFVADLIENGYSLPKRSDINDLSLVDDFPFKDDDQMVNFYDFDKSFISMVCVDVEKFFDGQKLVKKTLTIPKWSNDLGKRLNLNFSKLLTEAIQERAFK